MHNLLKSREITLFARFSSIANLKFIFYFLKNMLLSGIICGKM